MVAFNGPASVGWKPFGSLGQTPASITPSGGTNADVIVKAGALPRIAETVALLVAGGAVVYFIMTFAGGSGHPGGYR